MKQYYVFILSSGRRGTLYIGVTSELIKRIYEHKNGLAEGFSKEYRVHNLVYYEVTNDIAGALTREKQLKNGREPGKSSSSKMAILTGKIYISPCYRKIQNLSSNDLIGDGFLLPQE